MVSRLKALCIVSSLLVALPVCAEERSSSVPVGIHGSQTVRGDGQFKMASFDGLKREDVRFEDILKGVDVSGYKDMVGRKVDGVYIWGYKDVPTEMLMQLLVVRNGKDLSEEDIYQDIRTIYMSGFYKEVSHVVKEEDGKLNVYYIVHENQKLTGVEVTGTQLFTRGQLVNSLQLRNGDILNMRQVGTDLAKLTDEIRQAGFSLFSLQTMNMDDDGVLRLAFSDGIVDGFEIEGNKITKPEVILREMQQQAGKPVNTAAMERSGQRLKNLGLFDTVDFQFIPSPENPDHIKVLIVVEEGNNATVGVGVGYSGSDGTVGQFTIGDKNLFGKGEDLQFKWEFGGKTLRNYDISYMKPYLDKKGTTMQVNLYDGVHESAEYDHGGNEVARFDKRARGQEITFSRPDSAFTRNTVRLKNRKDGYDGAVSGYRRQYFEDSYDAEYYYKYGRLTTAEERRKEDFGTTRSVTFSRIFDNRDSITEPRKGKRNEIAFEWAGFGGDFNFRKLSFDQRYYWPAGEKGKHTVALDIGAGYAWGDMPLSQRFVMGGGSTLRGYEDGQFRGNSMVRGSLEYRVPVANRVSVLGFLDSGYAWDKRLEKSFDWDKIKYGFGLGLRVYTPIGPVKLDYGFGKREEGKGYKGRFHFSFGGNF